MGTTVHNAHELGRSAGVALGAGRVEGQISVRIALTAALPPWFPPIVRSNQKEPTIMHPDISGCRRLRALRALPFTFISVVVSLMISLTAQIAASAPGDEHWDRQFGWPGTTNIPLALRSHENRLYTGGLNTGGTTNASIDVWDGTRWSRLGRVHGSPVTIYDFEFLGNDVYV